MVYTLFCLFRVPLVWVVLLGKSSRVTCIYIYTYICMSNLAHDVCWAFRVCFLVCLLLCELCIRTMLVDILTFAGSTCVNPTLERPKSLNTIHTHIISDCQGKKRFDWFCVYLYIYIYIRTHTHTPVTNLMVI